MIGAQASNPLEKILSYLDIGKKEGAKVLVGGERAEHDSDLGDGYVQPTIFEGTNDMRVFQEEIFGPVLAVTTFKDDEEAMSIANDTLYGLGAGVFGRVVYLKTTASDVVFKLDAYGPTAITSTLRILHSAVISNPALDAKTIMMLDHYQQTKNMLVSYSP